MSVVRFQSTHFLLDTVIHANSQETRQEDSHKVQAGLGYIVRSRLDCLKRKKKAIILICYSKTYSFYKKDCGFNVNSTCFFCIDLRKIRGVPEQEAKDERSMKLLKLENWLNLPPD